MPGFVFLIAASWMGLLLSVLGLCWAAAEGDRTAAMA
jgi:hypothetical protein